MMIKEIPKPRLMSRKGISARGFFRPYMPFSDYTMSSIFSSINEITPVTVRFASAIGELGTADTMRNIKSMGVKFKTGEKDYDMMCSSMPVQLINDKDKLLDLFECFHVRRYFDGINKNVFWKFVTENPEALNCAVRLFSYHGVSDSFIYINWYSVNSAVWHNDKGDKWLVRYKWQPVYESEYQPAMRINRRSRSYAEFAAGFDPDIALNEIESNISKKKFPTFELYIQTMRLDEDVDSAYLDGTLTWDEKLFPYTSVGIMMLDEACDNKASENDITFVLGNETEGISLYRTELTDIVDYMCRMERMERG